MRETQPYVKSPVAQHANDADFPPRYTLRMAPALQIRLHYIPEWAERRTKIQADIAREMRLDKSTVSRWFDGTLPSKEHLIELTKVLSLDEPADLFRHPDDVWMAKFLRGRSQEERDRIRRTMELAFPPNRAA